MSYRELAQNSNKAICLHCGKRVSKKGLEDHVKANHKLELADGEADWGTPCQNCDELPTVHPTNLCGPCCFGEAETAGGNW